SRLYRLTPTPVVRAVVRLCHAKFTASVAGVFFTPDGRVLLLRHVYRHSYPWGLPSGFLNAGENPHEGLLREVREGTGLAAEILRIVSATNLTSRHLEIVMAGTVDRAQPARPSHEIFEISYVTVDALPPDMPPDQRRLVLELANSPAAR